MNSAPMTFRPGQSADEARAQLESRGLPGAPVVDGSGRLVGAVDLAQLDHDGRVDDAVDREYPTALPHSRLDTVLDALASSGAGWLPVTDDNHVLVGIVGMTDVITGYRRQLGQSLRQLSGVGGVTTLIQATVGDSSVLADRRVGHIHLPSGAAVLSIERANQLLFPDAETVIAVGDALSIVAPTQSEDEIRRMLAETTG